MSTNDFFFIEEQIILLLFIASLVGIAARRLRLPYTVGLVLVGLGLTFYQQVDLEITSELILGILIPPLVFEAAYHLNFNDLKLNLKPILFLTIPGVLITTVFVGGLITLTAGLNFQIALIFGALVSATDPDAVIALIRKLGVPKRLQVLLEGESLLNDGTVIVMYNLMLAIAITGNFNLAYSLIDFIKISLGGIIIGFLMGFLLSQMIVRIDDHLLETTLTIALAYGSYLVGESLGASGVMAVVAAGLVNGNIGSKGMSPTTRIVVFNFWETAAFISTNFVFLLIGLQINIEMINQNWPTIFWAIFAVLLSRALVVYSLRFLVHIPLSWRHTLFWGGLRGALAPALALGLPAALGSQRSQLQAMVFGVVLFNLLIQGITLGPLVRKLNLVQRSPYQDEYELRHARAVASRSALSHLEKRYLEGLISQQTWKTLSLLYKQRIQALTDAVGEIMQTDPSVKIEEFDTAWREALRAQRTAFTQLLRDGIITEDTFSYGVGEIDLALADPSNRWGALPQSSRQPSISTLVLTIIQDKDAENVINRLNKMGIMITRMPSTGGLLRKRNTTLLIGIPDQLETQVTKLLQNICNPQKSTQYPGDKDNFVEMCGATIFSFNVERFEEI